MIEVYRMIANGDICSLISNRKKYPNNALITIQIEDIIPMGFVLPNPNKNAFIDIEM